MKKIINKYKSMPDGIKASFWFMMCNILQKAVSFITIPIFTRLLSANEYGIYSIFTSWESILIIFATLNLSYQVFNNGMVKFKQEKEKYASSMIGLTLISTIICFIIYLLFNSFFEKNTGISLMYMILMFTDMFFVGLLGIWTVRNRYDYKYKILVIITIFMTLLNPILGIVFVTNFKNKVFGRILSMVIINALAGMISLLLLLKKSKNIISLKYWSYALKIDLPLIPHYLAMVFLNSSDRIMIGKLCDNSSVAYYSIAYNAAMIMNIFINSLNSSFNPWLYHKMEEKKYNEIKNVSSILIVAIAIVSIVPMFCGPEIIQILGKQEYFEASYIMSIISASVFMIYIYSLFINIELFFEKSKYVTYGSVLASAINILLNIFFINKYGYIAAGYTTLISYLILMAFHYIFMKKILNEKKIENPYNTFIILILSSSVIFISILIQFLYKTILLRYSLFIVFIIILFLNRNKFINIIKKIKNKGA